MKQRISLAKGVENSEPTAKLKAGQNVCHPKLPVPPLQARHWFAICPKLPVHVHGMEHLSKKWSRVRLPCRTIELSLSGLRLMCVFVNRGSRTSWNRWSLPCLPWFSDLAKPRGTCREAQLNQSLDHQGPRPAAKCGIFLTDGADMCCLFFFLGFHETLKPLILMRDRGNEQKIKASYIR